MSLASNKHLRLPPWSFISLCFAIVNKVRTYHRGRFFPFYSFYFLNKTRSPTALTPPLGVWMNAVAQAGDREIRVTQRRGERGGGEREREKGEREWAKQWFILAIINIADFRSAERETHCRAGLARSYKYFIPRSNYCLPSLINQSNTGTVSLLLQFIMKLVTYTVSFLFPFLISYVRTRWNRSSHSTSLSTYFFFSIFGSIFVFLFLSAIHRYIHTQARPVYQINTFFYTISNYFNKPINS